MRQDTATKSETPVVQAVDVFAQNRMLYEQIGRMEASREQLVREHQRDVQSLKRQSEEAYHEIESLRELVKQLDLQLEEEHRASQKAQWERENVKYGILQRYINLQRYNKYYAQCYTAVNMQVLAAVVGEFAADFSYEIGDQEVFDIIAELEAKIGKMEAKVRKVYFARYESFGDTTGGLDSVQPLPEEAIGTGQVLQASPGGVLPIERHEGADSAESSLRQSVESQERGSRDESAEQSADQPAGYK